jgi:hypothetical protein
MKLNANIVPLTEFSGGTATSLNNIRMALSLDRMFGGGAFSRDIILLIASSISNVPDKIIATVSAVFLIFSFGTLPNYIRQKEVMRKYAHLKNCKVIDNRVLLMFLLILPIAVLPIITFRVTRNPTAVIIMVALCAAAALFSAADRAYLRSIDRGNPNKLEGTEGIFFVIPEDFELKRQKDIFEDTLKMMVVLGSGLSFGIAAIGGTNVCASSETLTALSGCSLLYRLAVVNILILTAYRYSFMILIRMGGRV